MHGFPIVRWHHFNRIPWATIQESPIGTLARALLAADAQVWIYFNPTERRVILVRHPKHTCFNRAVFDAGG